MVESKTRYRLVSGGGQPSHTKHDSLLDSFTSLQIWQSGAQRAPHKPLLALWAIGRCLRGEARMAPYQDAAEELTELLRKFGPPRKPFHPEHPFWRLQNDGLWEVSSINPISMTVRGDPLIASLKRDGVRGGFPEPVFDALSENTALAIEIASALLDHHFPPTLHEAILDAVGVHTELAELPRRLRSSKFARDVLDAYRYQCAICNFSVHLDYSVVALDAAHIRWHSANGPDLVPNGLALCALHHRLFDVGAFTLNDDHRIFVAKASVTGAGASDALSQFHSRPASLPNREELRPSTAYLRWHQREVFRSPTEFRRP